MVMVNSVLMIIIGIFLSNKSKLLLGENAASQLDINSPKSNSESITSALEGQST
jgi:hypothetical protein